MQVSYSTCILIMPDTADENAGKHTVSGKRIHQVLMRSSRIMRTLSTDSPGLMRMQVLMRMQDKRGIQYLQRQPYRLRKGVALCKGGRTYNMAVKVQAGRWRRRQRYQRVQVGRLARRSCGGRRGSSGTQGGAYKAVAGRAGLAGVAGSGGGPAGVEGGFKGHRDTSTAFFVR
jgi:hypothetical protein